MIEMESYEETLLRERIKELEGKLTASEAELGAAQRKIEELENRTRWHEANVPPAIGEKVEILMMGEYLDLGSWDDGWYSDTEEVWIEHQEDVLYWRQWCEPEQAWEKE